MLARHAVGIAIIGALCCSPTLAQVSVTIDFESSSGYTPGALAGQDGWYVIQMDGAEANIIDTNNGPSGAGTQCLQLDNLSGSEGHAVIEVGKAILDMVANGGPIVTMEYDGLVVNDSRLQWKARVPDSGAQHWWRTMPQWSGCATVTGDDCGSGGGIEAGVTGEWYHYRYVILYGDHGDGQSGQMLEFGVGDNIETRFPSNRTYLYPSATNVIDEILLYLNEGYPADNQDVLFIDNIVVTGDPLPSAVPIADAGPDIVQDPGEWTGVVLDGSGSTDDGTIVHYRWSNMADRSIVYDGDEASVRVALPEGTYELRLEIMDDDGLQDTDIVTVEIGPLPDILDNVVGPWGIINGNIHNTSASDQIPVLIGPGTKFAIINESEAFLRAAERHSVPVFDEFGNVYFVQRLTNELRSLTSSLMLRWTGHYPGGGNVNLGPSWGKTPYNGCVIAGMRYIYVVGQYIGGASPAYANVYAFEKGSGDLVWETPLTEDWYGRDVAPKITLCDDKLYVVGEPDLSFVNDATIYQLDATTGDLEWSQTITVELNWEMNDPGGLTFVANAYGSNHGIFYNNRSDQSTSAGSDGYGDIVGIEIFPGTEPACTDGSATVQWGLGVDGPYLCRSHVMYSASEGLLYVPSREDNTDHPAAAWVYDANGLVRTHSLDDPADVAEHDYSMEGAIALDFDGKTIYATGNNMTIRSYTDNGDGTWLEKKYTVPGDYGGGFLLQGALLQGDDGHSMLFTGAIEGNGYGWQKILVFDMTAAAASGEDEIRPVAEFQVNESDNQANYNFGPVPGPDGTLYFMGHYPAVVERIGVVPAELGACCNDDGTCADQYPYECALAGGLFMGEGTTCANTICTGGCCFADGHCEDLAPSMCVAAGGHSAGLGSTCDITVCQQSDPCSGAVALTAPRVAVGDTTSSSVDPVPDGVCGASASDGPDNWYTVVGTGYNMTADLCQSAVYWDSQIAVFTGDCENLVCVVNDDDTCGGAGHPQVTWASTEGETYLIRVFGWDYQMGLFGPYELWVTDDSPAGCAGDVDCDGDIDFDDINPFVLALSGEAAYLAQYPDCRWLNGDCDEDGDVDFDDINPFVTLIGTTCP